jgi:hypothetical protein
MAEYLKPFPVRELDIDQFVARTDGNLNIKTTELKKLKAIARAYWPWYIVTDSLKKQLDAGGFRHMFLRPINPIYRNRITDEPVCWEMSSALQLPPMSSSVQLEDYREKRFDGTYRFGCYLDGGDYTAAEVHYLESEIRSLEPFDFAYTLERFGPGGVNLHPYHIASKRLYDFFVGQKVRLEWRPVRLDPRHDNRANKAVEATGNDAAGSVEVSEPEPHL